MPFALTKNTLTKRGYWKGAVVGSGSEDDAAAAAAAAAAAEATAAEATAAKVKSDALAEAEVEAAKQKAGSQMSEKEAELLKELMKYKTKGKESEAALLALKADLSKFDGINLDEVRELLAGKKESETKKLEETGQWDLLKKQMAEENNKLVKVQSDKTSELQALVDLQQSKIDKLTLGHSFNTSPFILNELTLSSEKTRIIYGSHFELEGDKIVAYDKPKGADSRVQLVDASGDSLGFEASMRKIIESDADKDRLIKSKQKVGSGSGTTGNIVNLLNTPQLKGTDRISKALDNQKK